MAVCPVCSFEEEDDSAAACSVCGSDLEVEESSPPEPSETSSEQEKEETETPLMEKYDQIRKESPEETPQEPEVPVSGDDESSESSSITAQYSANFVLLLDKFRQRLDTLFLDENGNLNYRAPAALLIISLLLFLSVVVLAVSTVPGPEQDSSDGEAKPLTPLTPPGESSNATKVRSAGVPFSGEAFNCELWDPYIYKDKGGNYVNPTDKNENGIIEAGERYGCPLQNSTGFTVYLILINLAFLISVLYLARHIPNSSITNPIYLFWVVQFAIFGIHGTTGYIFATEATIGMVAILGLLVASGVPLFRVLLRRGFSNPPGRLFYIFILAAAVLLAAVFHNFLLGPYAFCDGAPNADDLEAWQSMPDLMSECNLQGYVNIGAKPIVFSDAEVNIEVVAATLLLLGVGVWFQGNIRIRDLDEARFLAMIVSGLVLQYLILAYNVLVREDGSLSLGGEDTALTVMALGVAAVGVYSFYRKRQGEGNSVGIAYFGIFAAGIFALFALFIAPIALSGRELAWPEEQGAQVRVATALLVSLLGLWLSVRFISVKMKDFGDSMDSGELDSFTPSPGGPSADTGSGWKSVDDAMEYILEQSGDEYQIELRHSTDQTPDYDMVEKTMMSDVDISATIRPAIDVDYDGVSFEKISQAYSTSRDTIDEVITQLKSGRNIMLFGEPGTGKTALSNLLLTEICGEIEQPNGSRLPNYSIVTANAEWSNFDVIGGISPDDKGGYYFKDGYVAEAARACETSIQELHKPHYLIIDEFNRANIDEAFGKLFTVFEYRDKQPLLTHKETGGAPFFMPPEFRVIGTMNTQDKNTLFNVGMALMRRFAFIEIDLPDTDDEYNRMPIFCYTKLKKHGIVGERPEDSLKWGIGDKCPYFAQGKFDYYDKTGDIFKAYQKLIDFLERQEVPTTRGVEEPLGVRSFRRLGPALVIDSMVTIVNSFEKAGWEKAVNKVVLSNIMPSLDGLERNEIRCLALKAVQVFGAQAKVTQTLERMADSPGLSVFG
ncbi:MAG: hypothetical protein CL695_05705 [Chloroflexi bacterium]|nr:hypothetical protein [Chloroflexota bacterium]